eukprot:6085570-Alexandrium_andersonii.AAC.1
MQRHASGGSVGSVAESLWRMTNPQKKHSTKSRATDADARWWAGKRLDLKDCRGERNTSLG